ncbi:hypothetical protein Tco_1158707 [Tanacetum coccineum]
MHIFVGCFVYVVEFMILEDLGSIIDYGLSEVVLGKPFAQTSKLIYDEFLRLIRLYLMRRSLEVLRKFHWMILGGRSNQLSHVSSPLLSKPGEYYDASRDRIRTDKLKNHKEAVKNEQARIRESEKYKARAQKVKPQSNPVKEKPIIGQQKST